MSNSAKVSVEPKGTFQRMPVEPETDNQGMLDIYRKMMLVDLFHTHYGSWFSNLPVHITFLVVAMLLLLLTGVAFAVYYTQRNWEKIKKQMHEIVEAMPAYFFYDDEAPVKVRTVKDGIRSHEFYED